MEQDISYFFAPELLKFFSDVHDEGVTLKKICPGAVRGSANSGSAGGFYLPHSRICNS